MLHDLKTSFVQRTFFETADDNYIVARWCYINKLPADFHWLAVHAIEKFIKAALLLNGKSAKKGAHNVCVLFEKLRGGWPALLPDVLTVPDEHRRGRPDETPAKFLKRLYANGNEHNRYALLGYAHYPRDLFLVDQIVFAVRRLCLNLEGLVFPQKPELGTHAEQLAKDATFAFWDPRSRLDMALAGKRGDAIKFAAATWNLPFCPGTAPQERLHSTLGSSNSPLYQYVLDPRIRKGQGRVAADDAKALKEWVVENVVLPKEVVEQLDQAWPQP